MKMNALKKEMTKFLVILVEMIKKKTNDKIKNDYKKNANKEKMKNRKFKSKSKRNLANRMRIDYYSFYFIIIILSYHFIEYLNRIHFFSFFLWIF